MTPKIPIGWRRLRIGERIKPGDKWFFYGGETWDNIYHGGWDHDHEDGPIIRRVKKGKRK